MEYEVLKKEFVIESLGKGVEVIVCDFSTMRMSDCNNMTVGTINAFITQENTVFYKVVNKVVENE